MKIFLSVGTHPQGFDRVLGEMDSLLEGKKIKAEVFAQTGNSAYKPKNFPFKNFLPENEYNAKMAWAEIVISHGGAGTIINAMLKKKKLIIVPRLKKFREHTNDHQLDLARAFGAEGKALAVFDIKELGKKILQCEKFSPKIDSSRENLAKEIKGFLDSEKGKKNFLESKKILVASAIIFLLMFLFFYPNFYHYPDEQTYLRNAYLIFAGKMKITDPLYSYGYVFNGNEYVSSYPPLQSIIIAPFALISWNLAFLSGLALHLLNFFIFYKILKKLNIRAGFSLLYLFAPAIALLSTTLEAEISSITCILLAAYFYLANNRKGFLLAGFFAGLSVLARYTNAFVALAFFIAILLEKKDRKNALLFVLGAIPSAIIVLLYNAYLYGSPFMTAYSISGFTDFALQEIIVRIPYYILLLSIIYPLMFFAMFFAKNRLRKTTIFASIFFLILWGSYFFFYPRFRIEDIVVGADKFLPIVPLMLVCYAELLQNLIRKFSLQKHLGKIAAMAVILVFACSGFAMLKHKEKQDLKFEVFKKIYSETKEGALIIIDEKIPSLSESYKETPFAGMFFTEFFGDRKVASIKEDYSKYITDENNTFFMKITMEPNIEVEISPFGK